MKKVKVEKKDTTFFIPADELRAVYAATSREETRYYLNGVFVECDSAGRVIMTATDGHVLLSLQAREESFIGAGTYESNESGFILQADVRDRAFKAKHNGTLWIYGDVETGIMQFLDVNFIDDPEHSRVAVGEFSRVKGTYPDWRNVMPKESDSCGRMNLSPALIAKLAKGHACISHTKDAPMLFESENPELPCRVSFQGNPELTGVIMPVRIRE